MQITYYGCRGSLPTPGKETVKYGGNTTCLHLTSGDSHFILDGGSGLRLLGLDLMREKFGQGKGEAFFFWTHFHWDHIMGLPFFTPNYIAGNRFKHFGPARAREVLIRQQDFITFPVEFEKMPSRHEFESLAPGQSRDFGGVKMSCCRMNHPAGGLTYRFAEGDKSFVFATDVEHPETGFDPVLEDLCKGADLLIYDAQYTPEEYAQGKKGWGHSTWERGVELANVAGIERLHLWHHDQLHSDRFLEEKILNPAKKLFKNTDLAREGFSFKL